MATLAEVEVAIKANLKPLETSSRSAERRIGELERKLTQAGRKAAPAFRAVTGEIDRLRASVSRLAVGVGAALSVREIAQYADAWTEAGNKIRASAQSAGVQTRSLEELNRSAIEARTSFSEFSDLYARLIRSASGVAKSESEVAMATEVVAKAFKAGGASAQEAAAGIMQLGQALGSGVLQGDELRSIRENAPILAQAIADEFKTTIAGLKQLGADGKLTSDKLFRAIINAQSKVQAQFAQTNATIADSFSILKNRLTEYIGQMNEAYGITETVGRILQGLAANITNVANAAAAAGVVLLAVFGRGSAIATIGALANPWIALAAAIGAAAYAISDLWNKVVPLNGSFAELQDYAGAAFDVLTEGAAEIVSVFSGFASMVSNALGGAEISLAQLGQFAKDTANALIGSFVAAYKVLVTTFTKLPQAIAESVINAVNSMIQIVSNGIQKIVDGVNTVIDALNIISKGLGGGDLVSNISFSGLSGIENKFAGAGAAAGEAYRDAFDAATGDYIGDAANALTERANANAADRLEKERLDRELKLLQADAAKAQGGGFGTGGGAAGVTDGSGKGKKGSRQNPFEREIEDIKARTAAIQAETEAQSKLNPLINDYGYAVEKAKAVQELLNAAQKAGIKITPELRSKIDELAEAYAQATVEAEKLAESQEKIKERAEEAKQLGKDVLGGFISDLKAGKSAAEALANALNKVADKLLDMALNNLFNIGKPGFGNGLGSIFGGLVKILGFAEGGRPPPNRPSIVGERGPELFVPDRAGVIVPNHMLNPAMGQGLQRIKVEIDLASDDSAIAGIADSRIKSAAPGIVSVSIREGQRQTKQNMPGYLSNAQARSL